MYKRKIPTRINQGNECTRLITKAGFLSSSPASEMAGTDKPDLGINIKEEMLALRNLGYFLLSVDGI